MKLEKSNDNAISTNAELIDFYINLGSLYEQQGKWPSAIAHYRLALRINPNLAIVYKKLGDVWYNLKRCDRAIDCWYTAFNLEPKFIEEALKIYYQLGQPMLNLEEWEEAIAPLKESIGYDSNNSLCYYHLVNILSKTRYEPDILVFQPSLTKFKVEDSEVYYRLGEVLAKVGYLEEAISCYRQAVAWS